MSPILEPAIDKYLLKGGANLPGGRIGRKSQASTVRLNARGVVRLIADDWQTDQRNAGGQTLRERAKSALRHKSVDVRQHRRMRHKSLQPDVRRSDKCGRIQTWANSDNRADVEAGQRKQHAVKDRALTLIERT